MIYEEQSRWRRYPEAEQFVDNCLEQFVNGVPAARDLQTQLMAKTSTRLVDWVDHLVLANGDVPKGKLTDLGFEPEDVAAEPGDRVLYHPGAIFPRLVLRDGTGAPSGTVLAVALGVEDAAAFLMAQGLSTSIEGTPLSPYRRATAWRAGVRALHVVERRGHAGFVPRKMDVEYPSRYLRAFERWVTRPRHFVDRWEGMEQTLNVVRSLVGDMGADLAAWIAFAAERAYWQRRNRAAQTQRARQDRLGLGWANHDHHTFRSSRDVFPLLIEILETFGFQARERFYAGAEAGWGAQVMEQPTCRFAVFADVDLARDEVERDFTYQPLSARGELGTVGLWCALHGDSMLSAGLHHLAGRFEFDTVTADLEEWNVEMMRPFSDFSYLRQAFTYGQRWDVPRGRLEQMVSLGQISPAQADQFAELGAVGSHLENIQRGEGFKGFNQQTVSDIIRRTDPRKG
jgi:hypothetical protein